MRFTPQFLEELRARLPVSEVVGRRVKLKRAGREYKGLSPFQQEKTPSFTVNDQKQFYHDFSTGKHGNIFDFVMETEGVSFPEAVERLASMAGLPLPAVTPDAARQEQRRKTLYDVMELATKFFADTLASRNGAKARGYLADRAIAPATQLQFRIGYAPGPERFALKEYLGAQGIPVDDMVEAGLLIGGEDIPVPYDRFRDRVMFPITDHRGRVIAFGGRALEKDVPAKYLNSPETPLFHKGDNLYNLATARQAAHDGKPLIVVEGYVDVIAMVTSGFAGSVAPLGTALTENQLALLWKMADEPILCFDGDRAGQKAAWRAADIALPLLKPGKSLRFALLPEGQDPDDLARTGGRGAIEEVISAARGLSEVIWSREIEGGSFATPERRAALEARIGELSNGIRDEVVRRYYRQDLVERLQKTFAPQGGYGGRGNFRGGGQAGNFRGNSGGESARRFQSRPSGGGRFGSGRGQGVGGAQALAPGPYQASSPQLALSPIMRGQRSAISRREALILQSLICHPWLLHEHLEEIAALELAHPEAHKLRAGIIAAFGHDHHHSEDTSEQSARLRADLEAGGLSQILQRVERAITTHAVWGAQSGAAREDVLSTWHQLVSLHRQWHSLLRELKDAELALGDEASEANLAWLRDVKARMAEMDGTEALIEGFGESSGRFQRSV